MKIAMLTNNYLPFIGGVPISIERLLEGDGGNGKEDIYIWRRNGKVSRAYVWESTLCVISFALI